VELAGTRIEVSLHEVSLVFETEPGLFSPTHLDPGTHFLLSNIEFDHRDKVLDLGCGYGVMGIYIAQRIGADRVHLIDSDPQAIRCTTYNAELNGVSGVRIERSDGFRDFRESGFTQIVCNPPYHADFSTAKHFIEKGFNRLVVGGALWMVTHRESWYRNKLTSVFGGVQHSALRRVLSLSGDQEGDALRVACAERPLRRTRIRGRPGDTSNSLFARALRARSARLGEGEGGPDCVSGLEWCSGRSVRLNE
jgi:16S rRNA (guanine1207-N2)-methyltransferase